jgi:hypothetical protein
MRICVVACVLACGSTSPPAPPSAPAPATAAAAERADTERVPRRYRTDASPGEPTSPAAARAHDCAIVAMNVAPPDYWQWHDAIYDPQLARAEFQDPAVRAAVQELGNDVLITPPEPGKPDRFAKLRALCHR